MSVEGDRRRGIGPFACDTPLAELPQELVSRLDHRTFTPFRALGGDCRCGQSASESAPWRRSGASVELIARAPQALWLAGDDSTNLRARFNAAIVPPTDVGGRLSGWLAAVPGVLNAGPGAVREWTAVRCIVPAGAHWLRDRIAAVTMTMGRRILSAEERQGRVSISRGRRHRTAADHAILATEAGGSTPPLGSSTRRSSTGSTFMRLPAAGAVGLGPRFGAALRSAGDGSFGPISRLSSAHPVRGPGRPLAAATGGSASRGSTGRDAVRSRSGDRGAADQQVALALLVLPPGWGIAIVVVAMVIEVAEVGFWIRFLRRYRIVTGKEALIGTSAE